MTTESSPDYDEFTDSSEPNNWEIAAWILRTDNRLTRRLGWVFGAIFVAGSIAYGHHCAGGVDIVVYLGSVILSIGVLFYQAELAAIPFRKRIQTPVVELYELEGLQSTAQVVKSKVKGRGKNKFQRVVLVYRADPNSNTLYTKKAYNLSEQLGEESEFLIRLIPKIPTSAISKQKYDDISDPWSDSSVFRFSLSLLAPIMWCMAVRYTFTTDVYDGDSSFWIQGGLFWLFCVSAISSLCWAYAWTLDEAKSWLDGGARPIQDNKEDHHPITTNATDFNFEMV
jgi:hypothetical protein